MATIVIADDSPTLRRIVTSVLTREGHEVVQAEDGIGAVQASGRECIANGPPDVRLIVDHEDGNRRHESKSVASPTRRTPFYDLFIHRRQVRLDPSRLRLVESRLRNRETCGSFRRAEWRPAHRRHSRN